MNELPTMSNYTYNTSSSNVRSFTENTRRIQAYNPAIPSDYGKELGLSLDSGLTSIEKAFKEYTIGGENKKVTSKRRIVKVIIVDPDENVPLEEAVLVNEPERFTDLEDQELFYELDIKNILQAHNAKRIQLVNKKQSMNRDKDIFLEPIRIKDLHMAVVTIASF